MKAYGSKQYQQTQVTTVDKGRLIVLLYEGAIRYLNQAIECQESGDIPGKSSFINRAIDIINELNQSLNMQEGEEIAQSLRRLYNFWGEHLLKAKLQKDSSAMADVMKMMMTLADAWRKVCQENFDPKTNNNLDIPGLTSCLAPKSI